MITIIFKQEPTAHQKLQNWRQNHEDGFVINVVSNKNLMMHRNKCPQHLGTNDWEEGTLNWHTLGNATKICGTDRKQLLEWIKANYKTDLKLCRDCNP